MERYFLPIKENFISDKDGIIDMHNLNFPVDSNLQVKTSLLYLRNTGIQGNYDFSECTYEEKEEYLLLYLKNNRLDTLIPLLTKTWVYILSSKYFDINKIFMESILTKEEVEIFCVNNKEFLDEIYNFLSSIILCSMYVYSRDGYEKFDLSQFKLTEYYGLEPKILLSLFDFDAIILLTQKCSKDYKPKFYDRYFVTGYECYPGFINALTNKFPYLSLFNVFLSEDKNLINNFLNNINEILCHDS